MPPVRRIGIALAAYRPEPAFFAEQLASIQAQTFADWVCAITFDSPLLAPRPFVDDPRFVWRENPERLGHKKNFERAIQTVLGHGVDAIACCDQDDRWYPDKLATLAAALEPAPPLSLVHSDMDLLGPDDVVGPTTTWTLEGRNVANCAPRHLLIRNVVSGCSTLMDAELARRFPVIPDEVPHHDYWYAIVASALGGIRSVRRPLLAYRQHGANVVGAKPARRFLSLPHERRPIELLRKARAGWRLTAGLQRAAHRAGLAAEVDLGVVDLVAMGVAHMVDDLPLSRISFICATGKLLDTLHIPLGEPRRAA